MSRSYTKRHRTDFRLLLALSSLHSDDEGLDLGHEDDRINECLAVSASAVRISGQVIDPQLDQPTSPSLTIARTSAGFSASGTCTCDYPSDRSDVCAHVIELRTLVTMAAEDGDPAVRLLQGLISGMNLEAWAKQQHPADQEQRREQALLHLVETLNGLDADQTTTQEPEQRLAWRLTLDGDQPIAAIIQKRGKRGWTKGSLLYNRAPPEEVTLTAIDRQLLYQIDRDSWTTSSQLTSLADWRLLAQHPLLQGDNGEAVTCSEEPLRLTLAKQGDLWSIVAATAAERDGWISVGDDVAAEYLPHQRRLVLSAISPLQRSLIARRSDLRFNAAQIDRDDVRSLCAKAGVTLPKQLEGLEVDADDLISIHLRAQADTLDARLLLRPALGVPLQTPGTGATRLSFRYVHAKSAAAAEKVSEWCVAVRDLGKEQALATALAQRIGLEPSAEWSWQLDLAAGADVLERLAAQGIEAQWQSPALRAVRADSRDLHVRVARDRDWLGVSSGVRVDGVTLALSELLAAARSEGSWARLGGDRLIRLSDDLKQRLRQLAAAGDKADLHAAPLIADAVQGLDAQQLDLDATWLQQAAKLRAARDIMPAVPTDLRAELRDYQQSGFAWMARLATWGAGAVLADDMGLGKTVQAIAVLLHRAAAGPALVVCPTSVEDTWRSELARFAPRLKPRLYRGERSIDALAANDVLIASYGLVQRGAERFTGLSVATLVVDEAQQAKNADAKRSAVLTSITAGWRLALTGTPIENRLDELWSIMRFTVPGLLGGREDFRKRFADPIESGKDAGRRDELARRIAPFVLRRTKEQVLKELPPRTDIVRRVDLSNEERDLYDAERLRSITELEKLKEQGASGPEGGALRFAMLAALTRLRQLSCASQLVVKDSRAPSSKLDTLMELVEELRAEGHRALVFSQFTSLLDLVEPRLQAAGVRWLRLDGSTPATKRPDLVARFQQGQADVFLISLKAGGTGLTLTAASYVIHLDPWWNPAAEDQATDRAHRIGQDKPVTVYKLVAAETVEDRIVAMQQDKRDLVDALLADSDRAGRLSGQQLLDLVKSTV